MVSQRMQGSHSLRNGLHPAEVVDEYPLSSMLLMFSVGVGIGLVVGQTICESWVRAFEHESTADRVKAQLRQLWQGSLPEAAARHFGG